MSPRMSLLILVGSQTGCAQEVAEGIARRSRLLLWQVSLSSLDECDPSAFIDTPLVIIVCSTTGQGDIPDNCKVLLHTFLTFRNSGSLS
jgi:sulfite reductase alpha subunit-like flavoprotein